MVLSIIEKDLDSKEKGIILLSDTHLTVSQPIGRLDNYPETLIKKFLYICDWAFQLFGRDAIILQAGDFVDTCRSWNLLSHLMVTFEPLLKLFTHPIYTVFGQHDTYMYSEKTRDKTVLGILDLGNYVRVLSDNPAYFPFGGRHVAVYGASLGAKIPKVHNTKDLNILVIHKMMGMKAAFPGQKDFAYAPTFLDNNPDYNVILTGDLHKKFLYQREGRYILNSGPLGRSDVSDDVYNHKPGFYVYFPISNRVVFNIVPHESSDVVLSREHIDRKKEINTKLTNFIQLITEVRNKGRFDIDSVQFLDILIDYFMEKQIEQDVIDVITELSGEELNNARRIRKAGNSDRDKAKEDEIRDRSEGRGKKLYIQDVKKRVRTRLN